MDLLQSLVDRGGVIATRVSLSISPFSVLEVALLKPFLAKIDLEECSAMMDIVFQYLRMKEKCGSDRELFIYRVCR